MATLHPADLHTDAVVEIKYQFRLLLNQIFAFPLIQVSYQQKSSDKIYAIIYK